MKACVHYSFLADARSYVASTTKSPNLLLMMTEIYYIYLKMYVYACIFQISDFNFLCNHQIIK
jgi:hypothetical protein